MNDLLNDLAPMVAQIANEFGRSGRAYGAEADDFSQQMHLWIVENEAKVRRWLDPETFEAKEADRLLATSLRNECKAYAVTAKAQAGGYELRDLHWYQKGEVRALLPLVFNDDAWHEPPRSEGRSAKAPAEGGNWIATLADVAQAFDKLEARDRHILRRFHEDDWTNVMMAEAESISEQLMSKHHDRAISRLVRLLGGEMPRGLRPPARDPWQGRRAVTNSTARAYQSGAYDNE